MTVSAIISLCVSAASLLVGGGVIFKLIDIGKESGKTAQRIDTLEARAAEDRQKDAGKFDTLYSDRNETRERMIKVEKDVERITRSVDDLTALVNKIDLKIDGIVAK